MSGGPYLTEDEREIIRSLFVEHGAPLIRLRNPQTGAYLHMSGNGETAGKAHAWLGLKRQAKMIRERAKIRGEAFPYKVEEP